MRRCDVARPVPLFCETVVPSSPGTAVFKMEVPRFFETPKTTRLTTATRSDDLNCHQHRCGSSSNAGLTLLTSPRCADRTSAYSCRRCAARSGIVPTLRLRLADDCLLYGRSVRSLWRTIDCGAIRCGACQLCTLASDVLNTPLLLSVRNVSGATSRYDKKTTQTLTHIIKYSQFFPLSLVRTVLAVFVKYHSGFGSPPFHITTTFWHCSFWSLSEYIKTRRFIAVSTTACHLYQSWATSVHSMSSHRTTLSCRPDDPGFESWQE